MRLLIFGLGYTAKRVAALVRARGGEVRATGSAGNLAFEAAGDAIGWATHILSSVPPADDADPVLLAYGRDLARVDAWLGYLSSTGVYGDTGGAWVDETAPAGRGRRPARARADADWLGLRARVFRLPGIYGPRRSALDRVAEGKAHLTGLPDQVFSRVHVDDIAAGVLAAFDARPGAYNLADDLPCSQDEVIRYAARLLGLPDPPVVGLDELSPMARAFYAENRRVSNAKAKRVLGWAPVYPDYRLGLRAVSAITRPTPASSPPAAASHDQR
jgi:nucleoside-diphosphate-sugar epimerase